MHGNSHRIFRHPAANRIAKTSLDRTGQQAYNYGVIHERGLQMSAAYCGNRRHGQCASNFQTWHR